MAFTKEPIEIPQLNPDSRPWRIDWLGQAEAPDRSKIASQLSVEVFISPYIPNTEAGISIQQKTAWIPVGSLMHVRIGDVWKDGKYFETPAYSTETHMLDIKPSAPIKAGNLINEEYVLPFDSFDWHRGETGAYCLLVKIDESHQIVIPTLELILFYFGSSSLFLINLFQPYQESNFWEKMEMEAATGYLSLRLAKNISSASAADIGRIAASPAAMSAAKGIHKSIMLTGHKTNPGHQVKKAYTYMQFPFTGHTKLTTLGQWLPPNKAGVNTFVVYQIKRCTHPFPFQDLKYTTSAESKWNKEKGQNQTSSAKNSSDFAQKKSIVLDEHDPHEKKSMGIMKSYSKLKFPDLKYKSVSAVGLNEALSDGPVYPTKSGSDSTTVATGEAFSSGDGRLVDMVELALPEDYDLEKLPKFIKNAIAKFAEEDKIFVGFNAPLGTTTPNFPLPTLMTDKGVIDRSVQFQPIVGRIMRRYGCQLKVKDKSGKLEQWIVLQGLNAYVPEVYGKTWSELGFPFHLR